jgi:hypothetical protein
MYNGLPYYNRWLWPIIRVLMEKQYITLGDLVHSVQKLAACRPIQNPLESEPRSTGNEKIIVRNRHHKDAIGKGKPQCFKGMAGKVRFCIGDKVRIRKLPTILYLRTQEYLVQHRGRSQEWLTRASLWSTRRSTAKARIPNGSTSCAS